MGDTAMDHASMGHAPMEHNAADVPQVNETDNDTTVLIRYYDYLGTNHKDIIVIRQWGHIWINWRCDGLSET